jgi:hypothetical protein
MHLTEIVKQKTNYDKKQGKYFYHNISNVATISSFSELFPAKIE